MPCSRSTTASWSTHVTVVIRGSLGSPVEAGQNPFGHARLVDAPSLILRCAVQIIWTEQDQAVRARHRCHEAPNGPRKLPSAHARAYQVSLYSPRVIRNPRA